MSQTRFLAASDSELTSLRNLTLPKPDRVGKAALRAVPTFFVEGAGASSALPSLRRNVPAMHLVLSTPRSDEAIRSLCLGENGSTLAEIDAHWTGLWHLSKSQLRRVDLSYWEGRKVL